jgi:adenosylhomocysteine nucleosidase
MKTVVLISANAEWRVVRELYPDLKLQQSPYGEYADLALPSQSVTLFHGGWGKISAAATT